MNIKLTIPDVLGSTIQRTRRDKGIRAEEMIELLDASAHHYSDIENGRSKPGYNALIAIVRHLKIDPNEFFYPERTFLNVKRTQLLHEIETCSDKRIDILLAILNGLPEDL